MIFLQVVSLADSRSKLTQVILRESSCRDCLAILYVSIIVGCDLVCFDSHQFWSLGVSSDSFCSLLLPVLREKLPETWRLEWARQPADDFSAFLEFLQQEMLVRERAAGSTRSSTAASSRPSTGSSTVSGLVTHRKVSGAVARTRRQVRSAADQPGGRRDWQCVACGGGRHGLAACAVLAAAVAGSSW